MINSYMVSWKIPYKTISVTVNQHLVIGISSTIPAYEVTDFI